MWASRTSGSALLLVAAAGCDPGFMYVLPGASQVTDNGSPGYVVKVRDGVEARLYSSVFTVNGHVQIEIVNRSAAPLSFVPTPPLLSKADGRAIEPVRCVFTKLISPTESFEIHANEVVANGQRVRIDCRFPVELIPGGCMPSYPPEVRRVSFSQPGVSQSGRALEIRATMQAE